MEVFSTRLVEDLCGLHQRFGHLLSDGGRTLGALGGGPSAFGMRQALG